MILAVVMAAIGIHAWDDSKPTDNGTEIVPNVEWYAREDEYFDRRIDEHRTKNVSCIAKGLTPYSQIHTFVAFDELGNRYRVGVDSYAEMSPSGVKPNWDTIDLKAASIRMSGIGGKELATKAVKMPIRLQWGQPAFGSTLYVGDIPKGVDILMGLDIQDVL